MKNMTPEQIDAYLDMQEVKDKIAQGLPIRDILKQIDSDNIIIDYSGNGNHAHFIDVKNN